MTSWQPIETAPKDGSHILLFVPEEFGIPAEMVAAAWGEYGWVEASNMEYAVCDATHWAPLPEPPK